MRRSQPNFYDPMFSDAYAGYEDENDTMTDELRGKIGLLKTIAMEMGEEIKYHHNVLNGLSDGMENSRGFLGRTRDRVLRLGRGGHTYNLLFLFLFCVVVFFIMWIMLKFL